MRGRDLNARLMTSRAGHLLFFDHSKKRRKNKTAQGEIPLEPPHDEQQDGFPAAGPSPPKERPTRLGAGALKSDNFYVRSLFSGKKCFTFSQIPL